MSVRLALSLVGAIVLPLVGARVILVGAMWSPVGCRAVVRQRRLREWIRTDMRVSRLAPTRASDLAPTDNWPDRTDTRKSHRTDTR